MPTSQYVKYSSSDASGPGLITGAAGTAGFLLKTIFVGGYSGKTPAGWANPGAAARKILSFWNNFVTGTAFCFFLNDNGPNATSTFKEAWATGWESIAGVGSPVGSGTGQFPTAAQLLTTGHVVLRKSATADATGRAWVAYADAYSVMLFIASGDAAG